MEGSAKTVELKIPKLRKGSSSPGFLEPRRTAEKALTAVIQEASCSGSAPAASMSWSKTLGMGRISKSRVSRLCAEIDVRVSAFLGRPIEGDWPYLWIDATCVRVLEAGRIVSVAAIIAVGVNTDGRREVLGPSRRGSPTVGRRNPLRWFTRAGVRSPGAAPYKPSTTSASVAQRRSRASRKRSVSEPLSRRSSSAILFMVIVVSARC
jgi:transposase-like protein